MSVMNVWPYFQEQQHEYSRKQPAASDANGFSTA